MGWFSPRQLPREETTRRRSKRELESHDHGHDFVSSDGALVSICFLTFSVFLIKLVLVRLFVEWMVFITEIDPFQQIIYVLKRKHYTMNPTGTDAVGAVRQVIKSNMNARKMDPDEEEVEFYQAMRGINNAQ